MTRQTVVTTEPAQAARCLLAGGVCAIPTETVYGLAAVVTDRDAVSRVFAAKGRPTDHPLIVHVSSVDMALRYGDLNETALRLATTYWPGPLTLVVEASPLVPAEVTGGLQTVAIRMPRHPLALRTIDLCDEGLVAPSANMFGHVSPTEARHVLDDLSGRIDMVLDGGPSDVGVESTIVDCTGELQVLRPGAVTPADVSACTGRPVVPVSAGKKGPGMLKSHYAPKARVLLATDQSALTEIVRQEESDSRKCVVVGRGTDTRDYAANLYRMLRAADADGADSVAALLPRGEGLAEAIRDRLRKAAADSASR